MLPDQNALGMYLKIQNKLLNTRDLLFKKACGIAETMEGEDRNTQEYPGVSPLEQ